jgi:hypothetical protein
LEGHGYSTRADIALSRDTFTITITRAGLRWLGRGSPRHPEAAETIAVGPERAEEAPLRYGRGSGGCAVVVVA